MPKRQLRASETCAILATPKWSKLYWMSEMWAAHGLQHSNEFLRFHLLHYYTGLLKPSSVADAYTPIRPTFKDIAFFLKIKDSRATKKGIVKFTFIAVFFLFHFADILLQQTHKKKDWSMWSITCSTSYFHFSVKFTFFYGVPMHWYWYFLETK